MREIEKVVAVVVRDTTIVGWGVGNNIFGLKVPRHCPLVLLIGMRLELLELDGLHWNEI
jgi:hypothetical protein